MQLLNYSYLTCSELYFGCKFLQTALQSDPVTSLSSKKVVDHPPSPALLLQLGSLEQRMLIQVRVVSRAFELYWWQCKTRTINALLKTYVNLVCKVPDLLLRRKFVL